MNEKQENTPFHEANEAITDLVLNMIEHIGQVNTGPRSSIQDVHFRWTNGQAGWHRHPPEHYLWHQERCNAYKAFGPQMNWAYWTIGHPHGDERTDGITKVHVGRNRAMIKRGTEEPADITPDELEQALESLARSIAADLAQRSLAGVALRVRAKEKGAFALLKEATSLHERTKV
jgi:hypothetical protein